MADGSSHPQAIQWPPDYTAEFARRQRRLLHLRSDKTGQLWKGAKEYYKTHCAEFIQHWGFTCDPRNAGVPGKITDMPFIMFPKQVELVDFVLACLEAEADGLDEKCRDMGATWVCVGVSVWLWLFWEGVSVGWGSRKLDLVDKRGDMDSIFEKLRVFIRKLPPEFLPAGYSEREHATECKLVNPENGASITGEVGDNIGRGGRKRIYFKDESAHYEHPELIEASLGDNTRCQFDISSVNGLGNVFQRKREGGVEWRPGQPAVPGATNVFIMDWRDHPAKDLAWYEQRRKKAIKDGLLHKFEQEVNRNYAASVQGAIIESEWIKTAVGINKRFPDWGWEEGPWSAGLDVADSLQDSVGDRNAGIFRKGVVLKEAYEWGELDVGKTTRRMLAMCREKGAVLVQYDCIGMGSTVKAESNRLTEEDLMPKGVRLVPWDAGASPLDHRGQELTPVTAKTERMDPGDKDSPLIVDFYHNLKAQGWWMLRLRFWKTQQCADAGELLYPVDELIAIDDAMPTETRLQLEKELAQPTRGLSGSMKMLVNKTPKGTRSPNLGDGTMMAYWPTKPRGPLVVDKTALERSRMLARSRR